MQAPRGIEAKKMQVAVGAATPEQMDEWAKSHKPIPFPNDNATISRWRDNRRVDDSATFDPVQLAKKRKRDMQYFYDRTEHVTNLA